MSDGDNIVYLFGKDELDDELFRLIVDELVAHLNNDNHYDEVFRNYLTIAAQA